MSLMQMLSFGDTGWGMALLKAALMTVLLTLAALVVGALVGSLVAMAKLSKSVPCDTWGMPIPSCSGGFRSCW
ncbi:hypothetical protein [Pseudomonas sp. PE-S1G-1]|uniref:hypothetical protein n=1 Tax=Pseudomonas sp. PE-S1G-1 TaxID=1986995 RepID=UPI00273A6D93|nr:hypothetical protein [Pseudomonas sp. PE-S1G-1]